MFFETIEITLILAMLVAFFASGMTAYAGFGGALVMVPLFTLMIGPIQAIALTGLCNSIALLHVLPSIIPVVQWKEVVPLVAGLLIAVSVSADFIVSADQSLIQMCIGIFVLLAALIMICDLRYRGPRGLIPSFGIGALTGAIMGGAGVPAGPVMVIYYMAAQEPPKIQRANIMVSIWLLILIMLANLFFRDAITFKTATNAVFIVPVSIIGSFVGEYLFKRAPVTWFKTFAHRLLLVIGVLMIFI